MARSYEYRFVSNFGLFYKENSNYVWVNHRFGLDNTPLNMRYKTTSLWVDTNVNNEVYDEHIGLYV